MNSDRDLLQNSNFRFQIFICVHPCSSVAKIPAPVRVVDIAGIVRGASTGEGLGNKFLSHIREVDAILHVVRCFAGGEIIHVEGTVDPIRDIDTIDTELALADLETVSISLDKAERLARSGDKDAIAKADVLRKCREH